MQEQIAAAFALAKESGLDKLEISVDGDVPPVFGPPIQFKLVATRGEEGMGTYLSFEDMASAPKLNHFVAKVRFLAAALDPEAVRRRQALYDSGDQPPA